MRPRLGIVDVVGEQLLPAFGRGHDRALRLVQLGEPAHRLAADRLVVAAALQRREQPARAPAFAQRDQHAREAQPAAVVLGMVVEVIPQGDGGRGEITRALRPIGLLQQALGSRRPWAPSLDLQPQRLRAGDPMISMTSPCTRSQPGPMNWPSTRTETSGRRTRRAPPANVSDSPSAPGNSGASATLSAPTSARSERSRPPLPSRSTVRSPAVNRKRGARRPGRSRPCPAGAGGHRPARRRCGCRRASRRPRDDRVGARAQQGVPARDGGIAQRNLHRPIAAEARRQQRDATPRPRRGAHADSPARDQAGSRCAPSRALTVAASSTPAFVNAAAAASAARRSPAGQQRLEAPDGVGRRPADVRSLFVAGQRRLHPVDVAQRAPRVCRARLVAEVLVHERGAPVVARLPQQRAGPAGALGVRAR